MTQPVNVGKMAGKPAAGAMNTAKPGTIQEERAGTAQQKPNAKPQSPGQDTHHRAQDGATVIDASNAILGRLGTNVAKRLLKREVIHVVNAEKIVITGREEDIMEKYKTRRSMSAKANPHYGPKYPRVPDRIVKRAIRGMLPWKTPRGKTAFKGLRVHIGVPAELAGASPEKIEGIQNRAERGFLTIGEISRKLGAKQ